MWKILTWTPTLENFPIKLVCKRILKTLFRKLLFGSLYPKSLYSWKTMGKNWILRCIEVLSNFPPGFWFLKILLQTKNQKCLGIKEFTNYCDSLVNLWESSDSPSLNIFKYFTCSKFPVISASHVLHDPHLYTCNLFNCLLH